MASLNRVELIGNLGRDPEIRLTPLISGLQKVSRTICWQRTEEQQKIEETSSLNKSD